MKIAVVGGGSTYTPELIDGFRRFADLDEVVLIDPAEDRLDVVGPFAKRLLPQVTWTTDLDTGLDGADVVVIQLRVGGQQARISDETFPLACGCIGQETTGAGGFAKALRTVPVVLDVAARAAKRAPGAWIINFTNPVGIVTRALLDAGHKAAGLCNVAIGFQRRFASLLGVTPEEVTLDHIGLNHLTWERAAYVNGVDRLPELLADAADQPVNDVSRSGAGYTTGNVIGVSKTSSNPEAAWALIRFLTTETSSIVKLSNSIRNLPSTKDAKDSKDLVVDDNYKVFLDIQSNPNTSTTPPSAVGAAYQDEFSTFLQAYQSGEEKDLAGGLKKVDDQINNLVKLAG